MVKHLRVADVEWIAEVKTAHTLMEKVAGTLQGSKVFAEFLSELYARRVQKSAAAAANPEVNLVARSHHLLRIVRFDDTKREPDGYVSQVRSGHRPALASRLSVWYDTLRKDVPFLVENLQAAQDSLESDFHVPHLECEHLSCVAPSSV